MKNQHDIDFDPEQSEEDKHLLEYVDIVARRWQLVLATFLLVATAATVRTLMTRSVYVAQVQVMIGGDAPNVLSFQEVAEVGARRLDYYQTQFQIMQSRTLARRVIEDQRLLVEVEYGGPREESEVAEALAAAPGTSLVLEGVIDRFLSKLRVGEVHNSQVATLSFASFDPALAARIANDIADRYIQQSLEFSFDTSSEASSWLGNQVRSQQQKVEQLDRELQEIKAREGIVNIEERRTLLEQQLRELGSSLNALNTRRLEKHALYIQMASAARPEELPSVVQSSVVQSLRVQHADLERELAEMRKRYLEQHPDVIVAQERVREVERRIAAEMQRIIRAAENDYRATLAQEESVRQALDDVKRETLALSRSAVEYDARALELQAGRDVLDSLVSRHSQTDVARELDASGIRVLDRAVAPREPARPNRPLEITLGALLGLGLGICLAFFLDYLDNTIKTPEDIRQYLKVPLLAVIPESDGKLGPVVGPKPIGTFAEGYRVLRTALDYSWTDKGSRLIVVTSTAPGEGKTLTSVNLSFTLASAGARTLLIDADLRKPQVGATLRLPKRPGLSDVLVGQQPVTESIRKIVGSMLHVLVAGAHVPSPGDLITSPALEKLLEGLRSQYQYIVIDSPPVGAVADALIVGRYADGTVLVTGAEMVPRAAARHTVERINLSGARVLGTVLNRAQLRRHSYYSGHYYGHYYGQPYGREPVEVASVRVASIKGGAK